METLRAIEEKCAYHDWVNRRALKMYHRGQLALAIRDNAYEPKQSDYVLFVRERSGKD